jgi:voltage-gated potassium channel
MNVVTFISVLYIIFLVVELYLKQTKFTIAVTVLIDTVICVIFLFEFFYFFFKSKSKLDYTKRNFLDLLASLPFLLLIGIFPQIAVLNIFKMIRGLKNILKIYEFMGKRKLSSMFKVTTIFILIILYFSISIVYFEKQTNPNLSTFHDGLWWAVTTVTTVGYGDAIPVTPSGKVVAILLMLVGVGITSALSAIMVSFLLKPSQNRLQKEEEGLEKKENLSLKREQIMLYEQKKVEQMEKTLLTKMKEVENRLDSIDKKKPGRKKNKISNKRKK